MTNVAIIGTGGMAHAHGRAYRDIKGVKLVACCDLHAERAQAYAKEFKIKDVYTDVDKMLAQTKLDAVSIVTPDPFHAPIALKVLAAGKHVLCEKPLALNYADAKDMAEAAKRANVINMVNLSYRNAAAIQEAAQLVSSGALGEVRHVDASYYQSWLSCEAWGDWTTSPQWLWRLSSKHGSKGVLGDIGVHILDFASFPAGPIQSLHCTMRTFNKATNNQIGEYSLDVNDSAICSVNFVSGALGTVAMTRFATGYVNRVFLGIHGTEGALRIDLDRSYEELQVCLGDARHKPAWKTITCTPTPNLYQRFIDSIRSGNQDQPDFARGAEIQKALDLCFESNAQDKTLPIEL